MPGTPGAIQRRRGNASRRLLPATRTGAVAAFAMIAAGALGAPSAAVAAGPLEPPEAAARALATVDSLMAAGQAGNAAELAVAAARRWAADPLFGWQLEGRAGAALVAAGHAEAAVPLLEAAIGARPLDGALRHQLGLALAAIGRRGRALAEFGEASRLDPDAVAPRLEAGRLRGELGDLAGAQREWAAASALCGGCPEPDRLLASLLLASGRPAEAVAPLQRLRARTDDEQVRQNLLAALSGAGQDSALLALVGERAPATWSPDEWRQAVQSEGRRGGARLAQAALALADARDGASGLPRDDDLFWAHAAANLLAAADPAGSLAAIDRALRLRPGHPVYHRNRAAALAALGRGDEARRALDAAAGAGPGPERQHR